MTAQNERPVNWIEDHLNRYLETDGEDGHIFSGVPTLLLTTTGRKTGQPYTTPLIYGQDGDCYLLVALRAELQPIRAGTATWSFSPMWRYRLKPIVFRFARDPQPLRRKVLSGS